MIPGGHARGRAGGPGPHDGPCPGRRACSLLCASLLAALALGPGWPLVAAAQPVDRSDPIEIPDFEPTPRTPRSLLPPLPEHVLPESPPPPADADSVIRRVRFEGRSAMPEARLEATVEPFLGRPARHEVLEKLRWSLTGAYIDAGYVNSGARAIRIEPDGTLVAQIVEGRIGRIDYDARGRLPRFLVESLLRIDRQGPLNLFALEERARILRRDPRVEDVRLHVEPGRELGVAALRIEVDESSPWFSELEASNRQSPTVGAELGELRVGSLNLSGLADRLELRGRLSDGLWELGAEYDVPVSPWLTRLRLGGRVLRAEVVESPFDVFDIESRQESAWLELEQTVYQTLQHHHALAVSLGWQRSRSTIFGRPLDVLVGSIDDGDVVSGKSEAWVVRVRHRYAYRGRRIALATSNTLSRGVDLFAATRRPGGRADGEFLSWLAQGTAALRLDWLDSRLVARFDLQLASQRLLGFEQFPVGGATSVRGYRENQLVRDNGLSGSLEWRVPVGGLPSTRARLWIFPFFDYGRAWQKHPKSEPYEWIYSLGAGLRFEIDHHLAVDLAWAKGLQGSRDGLDGDLQDSGGHFRVVLRWP